jgi:sulfide dehydrogenase cytochrome subunit
MQNSIKILVLTMAMLLGLLQVPSGHAEELTRGAMLGASCDGCHGTDGHSPGSIPDISGKSAEFIRTSMEEFRSGERESTVMMRQAKGYTDEEMQLIAEYFAKRK